MKKMAIMQPYLFPYVPYFQLIHAVDTFVLYDDVNYIKQGWINRNYILLNDRAHLFTVPLKSVSSFQRINTVEINTLLYKRWSEKFLKTLEQAYRKAPFYIPVSEIIADVLRFNTDSIVLLAEYAIKSITKYLQIDTTIVLSSTVYDNSTLSGVGRVLDICKQEQASIYINTIGGKDLYSKELFINNSLELFFLIPRWNDIAYKQLSNKHLQGLSIIDMLMFNHPEQTLHYVKQYDLN